MAVAKRFEDLDVWIAAKEASVMIYKITGNESLKKDFGLKDQILQRVLKGMETKRLFSF